LTATELALLHPDRCTHLGLLVPAANLTNRDSVELSALQPREASTMVRTETIDLSGVPSRSGTLAGKVHFKSQNAISSTVQYSEIWTQSRQSALVSLITKSRT
jgi:hypothetical protein